MLLPEDTLLSANKAISLISLDLSKCIFCRGSPVRKTLCLSVLVNCEQFIPVSGHPNTRLFVSHCGGQSTLEAAYHGVPILAVPGFFDQISNANSLVSEGAAIRLNFNEITEENFLKTVLELLENPK